MVPRKRSCEGIRIIDIKTTYWGSNSCRERIAFIGLMLLKTLRIMSDSLWPRFLSMGFPRQEYSLLQGIFQTGD